MEKPSKLQSLESGVDIVYRGKMIEIIQWEGQPGDIFEAAVRAPGVRVLIETEKDGMKALVMSKEPRREAVGVDFRLPGGKVFNSLSEFVTHRETGQDIAPILIEAAQKEGKQEAGVDRGDFLPFGVSKAGSSVD